MEYILFGRKSGIYPEFSNFYPCEVPYRSVTFRNTEAAWQSQKDPSRIDEFVPLTGGQAKKLGRSVHLREDWCGVRVQYMLEVLWSKFNNNPELRDTLLNTGNATLIENTSGWRDGIWGMYYSDYILTGCNLLGSCLMAIRTAINKGFWDCPVMRYDAVEQHLVTLSEYANYPRIFLPDFSKNDSKYLEFRDNWCKQVLSDSTADIATMYPMFEYAMSDGYSVI